MNTQIQNAREEIAKTSTDPLLRGGDIVEHKQWNPYQNNGGTVVAVAGKDFVVLAADTRISVGYSILSRDYCKVDKLTSKCLIGTSGMEADSSTLHKLMKYRMTSYVHEMKKECSTPAIAQLLSNTLYSRRFFPFYTFNILAGLKEDGSGIVYGYDAIGSFDTKNYAGQGSGVELIFPVLDNQFKKGQPERTMAEVEEIVIDTLTSAAERDLYTGDAIEIYSLNKDGLQKRTVPLRRD